MCWRRMWVAKAVGCLTILMLTSMWQCSIKYVSNIRCAVCWWCGVRCMCKWWVCNYQESNDADSGRIVYWKLELFVCLSAYRQICAVKCTSHYGLKLWQFWTLGHSQSSTQQLNHQNTLQNNLCSLSSDVLEASVETMGATGSKAIFAPKARRIWWVHHIDDFI